MDVGISVVIAIILLVIIARFIYRRRHNSQTNSELKLEKVGENKKAVIDIIFVHGLGGDGYNTWCVENVPTSFWPHWLSEDVLEAQIWTLHYPAPATEWTSGVGMPLPDRATSVIDFLLNKGIGARPIIFITHSLGGLLIKQVLRNSHDLNRDDWKVISHQTKAVMFLATPHTGSTLASLADALNYINIKGISLRLLIPQTPIIQALKKNCPHLRELGTWYSQNARRLGIETAAYYEKEAVGPVLVVDEGSANPGVTGCVPIAFDGNHFSICKPNTRESAIYLGTKRFLQPIIENLDPKVQAPA